MSSFVKGLYDYGLVKKCSKCKIVSLTSTFHKNKNVSDGVQPICKFCVKEYYADNKDRLLNKQKFYNKKKRDKINTRMNEYMKNRKKTDVKFQLLLNTRRRIHYALKGKLKSSSTKDILEINIVTYRKWIEWQMTPEMNWSNLEIDRNLFVCLMYLKMNN